MYDFVTLRALTDLGKLSLTYDWLRFTNITADKAFGGQALGSKPTLHRRQPPENPQSPAHARLPRRFAQLV